MFSSKPRQAANSKDDLQERLEALPQPSAETGKLAEQHGDTKVSRIAPGRSTELEAKARAREPLARTERRPFVVERKAVEAPLPHRHTRRAPWTLLIMMLAGAFGIAGTVYYAFIATPGYVSEARFTVRGVDQGSEKGNESGLGNGGITSGAAQVLSDGFMVAEYLRSPAVVADISRIMDLRKMYNAPNIDFFSRLRPNSTQEDLFRYWSRRQSVDYDQMSGTVVMRIEAFRPEDAFKLANAALEASGRLLNGLTENARRDTMQFAQQELDQAEKRLIKAATELTAFQNAHGVLDPQAGASTAQTMIAEMQGNLATTRAQLASQIALGTRGPMQKALEARIAAEEAEIRKAQKQLTEQDGSADRSTASALISDIQPLQVERDVAQKDYEYALEFRQAARRGAQRTARYIVTYVTPVMPVEPIEPERFRMIALVWFITVVGGGIIVLLTTTLREHFL
jgi:capsular polysaccharide transport system permease protein